MTNIRKLCILILIIGIATAVKAQKQSSKSGLSALFFGDYYWVITNHKAKLAGNNGFWIRRIYLTYDHQISGSFSGRIRLEMNSEGDFFSNAALTPTVKDAYLKYSTGRHHILAGIAPTPSFSLVEEIWGYRLLAKSPLDLQDMASSRGLGVSFKGEFGENSQFSYHFMVANGSDSNLKINKGKKFMLSLSYQPGQYLIVQAYGDYETQRGNRYIYTLQGFIGHRGENIDWGLLFAYQFRNNTPFNNDVQLHIASVYANFQITKSIRGILRIDHMFNANPQGEEIPYIPFSDQAESTFVISGLDVQLHPDVHVIPNIEAVFYGENKFGNSPDSDIIARLTLFFRLE